MHKVHWGPVLISAAIGLALSAIPTNSAKGDTITQLDIASSITTESSGDVIHGLLFLTIVVIAVTASHLMNTRS